MSIEERRQRAEEEWQTKFKERGLDESFILCGREWQTDHGRKARLKCKNCGTEFSNWSLNDVFKGKQSHLICPECGVASDGADIWVRSRECDEAMAFYVDGHSVKETAEKFGVSSHKINEAVKARKITNGRDWRTAANEYRHKAAVKAYKEFLEQGGLDYKKIKDHHKRRAAKFKCEYDPSVKLDKLILRDGLRCAICGEMCDTTDRRYSEFSGPLYPSIDHIIPMSKGGGHTWDNVQVAHIKCNREKSNKTEGVNV